MLFLFIMKLSLLNLFVEISKKLVKRWWLNDVSNHFSISINEWSLIAVVNPFTNINNYIHLHPSMKVGLPKEPECFEIKFKLRTEPTTYITKIWMIIGTKCLTRTRYHFASQGFFEPYRLLLSFIRIESKLLFKQLSLSHRCQDFSLRLTCPRPWMKYRSTANHPVSIHIPSSAY